jgi:cation diffusion facilitator family transporter
LSEVSRQRAIRRVILLTFVLNLAVAGAKIAYGALANVLSIRADGFHSLTDSANNVVGLVGLWLATRPADRGHPYGHHKFEVLAAGVVGLSLLLMAYEVARGAIERLFGAAGPAPRVDASVLVVLAVTLVINAFISVYERRRGEQLESAFLLSDAIHTRSDVLVTLGVLVTAGLIAVGYPSLDLVTALVVAGFIAAAGIAVLRKNLGYLADAALLAPERVAEVVLRVGGVASTHKIRTRGLPGKVYVDLHIQIAPHLDVVQAHRVTHAVIDAIKGISGVHDVIVHTEPALPGQPYPPLPDEPRAKD